MRIDLIPSELRHAVRALASGPLFTGVAIGCLTLGIAANTAMFSVFDAMFLRPPPFTDADQLVSIAGRDPHTGRRSALSLEEMHELAAARSLTSLAAYAGQPTTLTDGGGPERIAADLVTANLLPMLGVQPQRGRGLDASDDEVSAARVALISDTLWHRRYEAEPSVLGRTIRLDDVPYTIVGVMPPGFRFPSESELWIPATPVLGTAGAASRGMSVVGRLAPGMTLGRANTELATRVLRTRESHSRRTAVARAFGRASIGSDEAIITGALMGATTLLLVLACVNLANLLLARGLSRRQEIAVRVALGATRWRIARQLFLEPLLLAAAAGAIAVPLAWYGIWWLHQAVPPSDPLGPYYMTWSLDTRTLLYALTVALATGILSGIIPVLVAASRRPANPLRERAGAAGGRTQRRIHGGLIAAQTALALVLLASAWIFVRTYVGLSDVNLGYDVSHLMTMRVDFAGAAYDSPDARARAVDELASRLEALPVARGATVTDSRAARRPGRSRRQGHCRRPRLRRRARADGPVRRRRGRLARGP